MPAHEKRKQEAELDPTAKAAVNSALEHQPEPVESTSLAGPGATAQTAAAAMGHWGESEAPQRETAPEGPGDAIKPVAKPPVQNTDPLKDPAKNPDPKNEFAPNAEYGEVKGVVAVKGEGDAHEIDPSDAKQGSLGDCYLVAQLAAQAKTNPDRIKNLIKDNGDNTFTVTLYLKDSKTGKRQPRDIVVDSQFPQKDGKVAYAKPGDVGETGPELWVMLIEKAWAKVNGSYEEIRGKKTKDADVFGMMSGEDSAYVRPANEDASKLQERLTKALANGQAVSFDAINPTDDALIKEMKAAGVVANHAYSLLGVDAKARTVSLRNPWGVQHLMNFSVDNLAKFFSGCRIAAQ